jgi:uncharacterized membrane protein
VTDDPRVPAGLTPERVGFFTDAVFAIAMTLLVIEIPRPEDTAEFTVGDGLSKSEAAGNLLHFFGGEIGSFVAYLLAFLMLWITWRQHHQLFDRIERLSPRMVSWHFPFLLLIGFLPFPTTVFGNHTGNPVAAYLFTATVAALRICWSGLQSQALRDRVLRPHVSVAEVRAASRTAWIIAWYWVGSALLGWWTPWIIVAWSFSPILGGLLHARDRRTHTPRLVAEET